MTKTPLETVNEMIASAEEVIAEMAAVLKDWEATNVLRGENYIIANAHGLALNFDMVPSREHVGMSIVENPRVTLAHRAIRFSRHEAERIARNVFTGDNKPGHAVAVKEAVAMEHESYKFHLSQLIEARERIIAKGE